MSTWYVLCRYLQYQVTFHYLGFQAHLQSKIYLSFHRIVRYSLVVFEGLSKCVRLKEPPSHQNTPFPYMLSWEGSRHFLTTPLVSGPGFPAKVGTWCKHPHKMTQPSGHGLGSNLLEEILRLARPSHAFEGETTGGVAKCRLFSQANWMGDVLNSLFFKCFIPVCGWLKYEISYKQYFSSPSSKI